MEVPQRRLWSWAAAAVAIGTFFYFAYYRVRYIGGCDSSAYLVESWRLRGLDVGLTRDPSVPHQGALVPLCMVEHAHVVRSFFPPGLSLLLAGAGLLGLEFYLTPALGALSGFVMFLLARSRAGSPLALATMMAWLATPLALWGSTQAMSDLPAATFLLVALFAADQKKTLVSGLVAGWAMGVRPETALFLPALIAFFPSRAEVLQLAQGLALAGVGWLAFVLASFGSLHLPYTGNLAELNGENFGRQATFLIAETARQHAPVVALALVALVRSPRVLPYFLWFTPFVVLHALWRVPYDAWWHARFVLPALPALFLLAALGAASLGDALRAGPVRYALGGIILAGYLVWCFTFPPASIHRVTDWDQHYARESRRVAALLPKEALVGAVTYSAPLRYYGRVETFLWCHIDAPALIPWALDAGRPVYAVLEGPVDLCEGRYSSLLPSLDLILVEELSHGRRLVRLARAARGAP